MFDACPPNVSQPEIVTEVIVELFKVCFLTDDMHSQLPYLSVLFIYVEFFGCDWVIKIHGRQEILLSKEC